MARTSITHYTADEPVDLGTKRLYVNAVIKSNCPVCGAEYVRDCSNKPLSYPTANSSFTVNAYCQNEECNHEWPVGGGVIVGFGWVDVTFKAPSVRIAVVALDETRADVTVRVKELKSSRTSGP